MKIKTTLITFCLIFGLNASAPAAIDIIVDSGAESITFSGSVTVTPGPVGIATAGTWTNTSAGSSLGSDTLDVISGLNFSSAPSNAGLFADDYTITDFASLQIFWFPAVTDPVTITGTDTPLDYSSNNSFFKDAVLELAQNNTVLSIITGSSSDTITMSAVPEPGFYASIAGLAVIGYAVYRRRSK